MIDFDDLDESAAERVAAGDNLDEAALAALSCPTKGSSDLSNEVSELSLDDLLRKRDKLDEVQGSRRVQEGDGASSGTNSWRGLEEVEAPAFAGVGVTQASGRRTDAGLEGSRLGPDKHDAKAHRRLLCFLNPAVTPATSPPEEHLAEEHQDSHEHEVKEVGLPTETTAEAGSVCAEHSCSSREASLDAGVAGGQSPRSAASLAPLVDEWPACPDEVRFAVLDNVLPMRLPSESVLPQEVARIWEEEWGVPYAGTLRFRAPRGSSRRWLNPREDLLPCSPAVVGVEGKGSVLCALALALRQRNERLKDQDNVAAARRRLQEAQLGTANLGPRIVNSAGSQRAAAWAVEFHHSTGGMFHSSGKAERQDKKPSALREDASLCMGRLAHVQSLG
eukprot:CAMPEP_0171065668 /NCGR_PEP_ID=MMETSP0766_2-20121228/6974_1 /TAXON_ID=439317 /ORGANISM="Gambierdiscus australes, Strain CAWD 149" /LENGTH=390 /DNA_ID=CAMNT_0011521785 /DNA_START=125 /DNA_END=1298 /DNA_ORIENTATION=-